MQKLTVEKIRGHRTDTFLFWIPEEKYLYAKKEERSGKIECICYQSILTNPKKARSEQIVKCTARRIIDSQDQVTSNGIPHSIHSNHELIYKDLISRKNIADTCIGIKNLLGDIPVKVSVGDIFTREIAT